MDFVDYAECDSDCRTPINRAQRRERDQQKGSDYYMKKSEKKNEKRRSRSCVPMSTPTEEFHSEMKSSKPSRCRSLSEGQEKEEVKENSPPVASPNEEQITPVKERRPRSSSAPREQGKDEKDEAKHQRKLCKSALKRQQEVDRTEAQRLVRAKDMECAKEEEAFEAEAQGAAARRRAVWEAKDAAAKEAIMAAAAENKIAEEASSEGDALKALEREAANAAAAIGVTPSTSPHHQSKDGNSAPSKYFSKGQNDMAVHTTVEGAFNDPDLDGWEIL